MACKIP